MSREVDVRHFVRKAAPTAFSLERVFHDVRQNLPSEIRAKVLHSPCPSQGLLNRLRNIVWAWRNAGQINHITGDVHYLSLLLPKRKTVLTIPDCSPLFRHHGLKRAVLWLFWYRMPTSSVALITTISEFTKQEVLKYVNCDESKIRVVHCPVSPEFRRKPKPTQSDPPRILQIGTGWNKNLTRVVAALRGLPCRLLIVGALTDHQQTALAKNEIAYDHHPRPGDLELLSLYESCDLVVFASIYEGFGLPIIEAQAVGRPVVTSNLCSMPEVAGDAAAFVNPYSVTSIRNGIKHVLEDEPLRRRMITGGYSNVNRFDPSEIAGQYCQIYNELCNKYTSDN